MIKHPKVSLAASLPLGMSLEDLSYPFLASRKLDGIRCLIHPELGLVSRTFKPIRSIAIGELLGPLLAYAREHQVIIQICAYGNSYWPGYIRTQYDFWKEKMASLEFENPYRGPIGMCYYKQETIMQNEELQNEIREVNKEIIRR